jgi:hypothetical protein
MTLPAHQFRKTPSRLPTPQSLPDPSIRQFCFVPPAAATAATRAAFFGDQASEFCCRPGFNALSLACSQTLFYFWRHSFLKSKYSVTNSPICVFKMYLKISPNCDSKWLFFLFLLFFGGGGWGGARVSPRSCLLATHLCVLWKRVAS